MIEFDCEEVKRQLNRLAALYPEDHVDIWLKWERTQMLYTCFISGRAELPNQNTNGDELVAVVDEIIKIAGARGGADKIRAKREAIEKARQDLFKLESELDPLVMAVDKAIADSQTTNQPSA